MLESALLFMLGFSGITTVYEIAKTGKGSKSDKIKKQIEKNKK